MRPREADKVKLFASIFTNEPKLFIDVLKRLTARFGPLDMLSEPFDFTDTDYYAQEFGKDIRRRICSFETLIEQDAIAGIKIFTNEIEDLLIAPDNTGRRRVNIDPGYVALPRFVLASCKEFSHRVYAGSGVYADLTLRYVGNGYQTLPWTYPDYKGGRILSLITQMRSRYAIQLGRGGRKIPTGIEREA